MEVQALSSAQAIPPQAATDSQRQSEIAGAGRRTGLRNQRE
ncbi:MAG: hypothetical protein OXB96_01845 [Candidatus Kaiserbacteria bacterium]|nr:hypothetical protein [Candidatus Kaiserbacteria bacterium]